MKSWYLLYCKPREEQRAQQNLALQQVESYLPMITQQKTIRNKKQMVTVPLFPSYLFIYFDPELTSVSKIHNTRGANRIVGCREDMTPIDDRIISALKRRVSGHIPEVEKPLTKGDKVKFVDGPFKDLEAIFDENNPDKRCHVLFTIMGQQKRILVELTNLKPIDKTNEN
ncbi:transcription/translation regulatory transformer protein RfaH [Shewanella inventionis]|uniref:Transcription antitermination protein RfaH n=1 Tax=Shewanella inventionis TaxID=1738770 RepID=A0ABQ1J5G6_9GAMM|nr:transcription/translation regulatory transformer protein RfaH [Shewanella inventionis]MCL1159233.1 transcription/translation regulatory transformer protein RfaH [Shewanella inventionis]GGB60410.1 transcription antitermination protein RfaH [Shewanella inventionis]